MPIDRHGKYVSAHSVVRLVDFEIDDFDFDEDTAEKVRSFIGGEYSIFEIDEYDTVWIAKQFDNDEIHTIALGESDFEVISSLS